MRNHLHEPYVGNLSEKSFDVTLILTNEKTLHVLYLL